MWLRQYSHYQVEMTFQVTGINHIANLQWALLLFISTGRLIQNHPKIGKDPNKKPRKEIWKLIVVNRHLNFDQASYYINVCKTQMYHSWLELAQG